MAERLMSLRNFVNNLYIKDGDEYVIADVGYGDVTLGYLDDNILFKWDDGFYVPVSFVKKEGGGEGGGQYCYTILEVGPGYFVKIEFSYYSYNGYEYDHAEVFSVTPVDRVVTFYE